MWHWKPTALSGPAGYDVGNNTIPDLHFILLAEVCQQMIEVPAEDSPLVVGIQEWISVRGFAGWLPHFIQQL